MSNTCSFEGCANGVVAKGFCTGHYRQHRAGEPLRSLKPWQSTKGVCSFPECGRERYRSGWCRAHAAQHYSGQPLAPLPVPRSGCDFEGCPNPHRAKGYCSSHLWQLDQGKQLTPLLGRSGRKHDRCTYPQCGRKHSGNGLCRSHNSQLQRGQELRPITPRPNRDVRHVTKQGYVLVRAPEGHPNAKKNGYIFEHTLVMTTVLAAHSGRVRASITRTGSRTTTGPTTWNSGLCISPREGACRTRSSGRGGSSGNTATPSSSSEEGIGPSSSEEGIAAEPSEARPARSRGAGYVVDTLAGGVGRRVARMVTNPDMIVSMSWKLLRRGPVLCSPPPRVAARCSRLRTLGPLYDQCSYPGRR